MIQETKNLDTIKSEEVQVIIDRMPTQWTKYVALITSILISLVISAGFIIRYPDTVDGQISVTASIAPVRLVANASGKLHLLEPNKTIINEGNVIAYIEGGADYRDVLLLDSLLKQYSLGKDNKITFPSSLALGEMASAYNSFMHADKYNRIKNTDIYSTMRAVR